MNELRIGTREREQVVRALMKHQGQGRLTAEEYQERLELARLAVFPSELEVLLADLESPKSED